MKSLQVALFFSSLLAILAGCLLGGCTQESADPRDFYYPLAELAEGQVYEYRSAGDELDPPFYWYYRTLEQGDSTFLTGMYYDHQFQPFQFLREEAVSNGMLLADFYLYETDSTGKQRKVPVQIAEGNVFPFGPPDPHKVLLYSISWQNTVDSTATTHLIRNRQYLGDTTITYRDQTYDAVRFYVRELVDIEKDGHAEHEFDGLEIYARGLGLVYFRKNITDDFKTEYRLVDRFPMTELERRFSESQSNE